MIRIIAHRGARSLAPENTITAARAAQEAGADLWETDVTVTGDGELILMHDDTLERTTDARFRFPERDPWPCSSFHLDEIRSLDAGSWYAQEDPFGRIAAGDLGAEDLTGYRGERVPTLQETLRFTRDRSFPVNLELKHLPPALAGFPLVERVLTMIDERGVDHRLIVVSSFHHDWLRAIRQETSSIAVQALIGEYQYEQIDWEGPLAFETYNVLDTLMDEGQVRMLIERGISLNIFTVNQEAELLRFAEMGVTGLITDFPQRAARLLR